VPALYKKQKKKEGNKKEKKKGERFLTTLLTSWGPTTRGKQGGDHRNSPAQRGKTSRLFNSAGKKRGD